MAENMYQVSLMVLPKAEHNVPACALNAPGQAPESLYPCFAGRLIIVLTNKKLNKQLIQLFQLPLPVVELFTIKW